jgi:hypothetical protein
VPAPDAADRYESAYALLGDVRRLRAGQKPRLETAAAPVPSQSFGAGRPPTVEPPSSSQTPHLSGSPAVPPPAVPHERLGNLVLLLAIAVLVGAATFVVVRERQGDVHVVTTHANSSP